MRAIPASLRLGNKIPRVQFKECLAVGLLCAHGRSSRRAQLLNPQCANRLAAPAVRSSDPWQHPSSSYPPLMAWFFGLAWNTVDNAHA